jgi:hypothetical protein
MARVLVACEFSGIVRDAFAALGHDAWSCDLLPTERPGNHIQGDVLDIMDDGWDLMIAHPPCQYLSSSGLHWNGRREGREQKTEHALRFVADLLGSSVHRIALENPIGCISSRIRKPDQIIQPWQFGEDASKATCLWLKGLPLLHSTNSVERPVWMSCPDGCDDFVCTRHRCHTADCECPPIEEWADRGDDPYTKYYANQTPSGQNKLGPSPTRAMDRARTYPGIALAMAQQWGAVLSIPFVNETQKQLELY